MPSANCAKSAASLMMMSPAMAMDLSPVPDGPQTFRLGQRGGGLLRSRGAWLPDDQEISRRDGRALARPPRVDDQAGYDAHVQIEHAVGQRRGCRLEAQPVHQL